MNSRPAVLLVLVALCACGPVPDAVSFTVTDSPDALTPGAGDNLFTLTMTQGSEAYELADVLVAANLPGQTATAVNFTHTDANGNGKLDKGDALVCKEPPVSLFDATTVGKSVKVALTVKRSGASVLTSVASETWVPAN